MVWIGGEVLDRF